MHFAAVNRKNHRPYAIVKEKCHSGKTATTTTTKPPFATSSLSLSSMTVTTATTVRESETGWEVVTGGDGLVAAVYFRLSSRCGESNKH